MVKVESSLFLYKLSIRIQYDSSNGFLVFLTQSHFHDELKIVDLNISSYIKCNLICTFIFCETRWLPWQENHGGIYFCLCMYFIYQWTLLYLNNKVVLNPRRLTAVSCVLSTSTLCFDLAKLRWYECKYIFNSDLSVKIWAYFRKKVQRPLALLDDVAKKKCCMSLENMSQGSHQNV